MRIKLPHCTLRYWQKGDEDALVRHADNYKIWLNVRDRFPHPYTYQDAVEWIQHARFEEPLTNFAITLNDEPVGGIGLVLGTDIHARSAEVGYWLGEDYWGRGIVSDALKGFTEWAFSNFDLCRLWAGVFEHNAASARVLVKAGYQFEARLRQAVTKEGRTMDELVYARLHAIRNND